MAARRNRRVKFTAPAADGQHSGAYGSGGGGQVDDRRNAGAAFPGGVVWRQLARQGRWRQSSCAAWAAEEGIRDPRLSRSKCPGDLPAEALSSAGKVPSIGRWGGGVSRSDSRSCRSTLTQCLRGSRAPILAGAGGSRLAGFQSLIDSRPRSDFAVFEDALDESRRR